MILSSFIWAVKMTIAFFIIMFLMAMVVVMYESFLDSRVLKKMDKLISNFQNTKFTSKVKQKEVKDKLLRELVLLGASLKNIESQKVAVKKIILL